ncbi:unnamed protein product [Leptosia nina]|uniref:Uncharacterized protein n=1 Tax=Leptosia nina TaxID=320188 RepID=A0AAV1J493_9NEOP
MLYRLFQNHLDIKHNCQTHRHRGKVRVADSPFPGACLAEGSTINPISELSSSGALPFYMTLARFAETTVQCEESGRCVVASKAGCLRACMTLHITSNTARRLPSTISFRSSVKKKPPLE